MRISHFWSVLTISILASLNSGCVTYKNSIPSEIFNEISIVKPKQAQTHEELLEIHLDYLKAYKDNLLLLETIKKLQK